MFYVLKSMKTSFRFVLVIATFLEIEEFMIFKKLRPGGGGACL